MHNVTWFRLGVEKIFSCRATLTIQELAEGQCLKSCKSCIQCWWLVEGCKCLILDFENDGFGIKVITLYLDGKCVDLNHESCCGFFNGGFYRFCLFSTASMGTPVILNRYSGTSGYEFNSFRDGVHKVIYSYAKARFTCK